jgi:transposase
MRYAQRGGYTPAEQQRRERLSPQQFARLEAELRKGPLAHGFAGDQRWTLGRVKTLIGKLFHVGYTVEGTWKLLRRHGWSCQVPELPRVSRTGKLRLNHAASCLFRYSSMTSCGVR